MPSSARNARTLPASSRRPASRCPRRSGDRERSRRTAPPGDRAVARAQRGRGRPVLTRNSRPPPTAGARQRSRRTRSSAACPVSGRRRRCDRLRSESSRRSVVGGRRDERVVERERPGTSAGNGDSGRFSADDCRRGPVAGRQLRATAASARPASTQHEGKCTTTSCGPARRHTAIIASILLPSSDPSNHHRSRFRLAVHAADRAAAARAVGLLGDLAAGHAGRDRFARAQPAGIILSGGPKSVSDAGRAELRSGAVRPRHARCSASATACS